MLDIITQDGMNSDKKVLRKVHPTIKLISIEMMRDWNRLVVDTFADVARGHAPTDIPHTLPPLRLLPNDPPDPPSWSLSLPSDPSLSATMADPVSHFEDYFAARDI